MTSRSCGGVTTIPIFYIDIDHQIYETPPDDDDVLYHTNNNSNNNKYDVEESRIRLAHKLRNRKQQQQEKKEVEHDKGQHSNTTTIATTTTTTTTSNTMIPQSQVSTGTTNITTTTATGTTTPHQVRTKMMIENVSDGEEEENSIFDDNEGHIDNDDKNQDGDNDDDDHHSQNEWDSNDDESDYDDNDDNHNVDDEYDEDSDIEMNTRLMTRQHHHYQQQQYNDKSVAVTTAVSNNPTHHHSIPTSGTTGRNRNNMTMESQQRRYATSLIERDQQLKMNQLLARTAIRNMRPNRGNSTKALPSQFVYQPSPADNAAARAIVHHTGSHYHMAGSKQYQRGVRVKGVVSRHSQQGAKLQNARMAQKNMYEAREDARGERTAGAGKNQMKQSKKSNSKSKAKSGSTDE